MSNQTAAAFAALGNSIDWENEGLDLQAIIEAGNQRKLGKPLTEWLASRGWEASAVKPSALVAPKDLDWWLDKTEEFTKKHLGVTVDLRKQFVIPTEMPWASVIPVFDPGALTSSAAVKKALKSQGLTVYEEVGVDKYSGFEAGKAPTLDFIENSVKPNTDTMGKSPDDLRATGKRYLRLRGYALAMAVYHFATGEYLDPETFTWFPEDRLPDGNVACGYWNPTYRRVRFGWSDSDYRSSDGGGRAEFSALRES